MRLRLVPLLLLGLLALAACKDKIRYWQPSGAPKRVDLTAEKKAFLMPVTLDISAKDPAPLSAGLVGGFSQVFSTFGVQGQPLRPAMEQAGLGELPKLLVLGMAESAFTRGEGASFQGSYKEVPKLTTSLFGFLKQQGVSVRYLGATYVQERELNFPYSLFAKKRLSRIEVTGGIFDLETQQAVVVVNFVQNVSQQGMAANMTQLGTKLAKTLLCPAQDKDCEAAGLNTASLPEELHIWRNPAYTTGMIDPSTY